MPTEFSKYSARALEALPKAKTVFFFPVGVLEDHGPHLPMNLDVLEAEKLCTLAAEKLEQDLSGWQGVIMPSAPLGVSGDTTQVALTVRGHVLRDWLIDSCRSLERMGFAHFVCFSGTYTPKQLTAIEEAGKIVSKRGLFAMSMELLGWRPSLERPSPTLVSVYSGLISPSQAMQSPLWPDPKEHGGRRDTSVALFLNSLAENAPELQSLPAIPQAGNRFSRLKDRLRRRTAGYWGAAAPMEGTPAIGKSTLDSIVSDAYPKLRAVWEGANPNFLFRSYYSVWPTNKSFFKGWVLTVLLVALMIAWISAPFGSS